ncbi:MAG: thiol protease/hemagglutinin PrtT [Muribaculaceae bacterium]|nr:thiol protease/hemagglutinin PrtT [Muribaculaceae bacterium]
MHNRFIIIAASMLAALGLEAAHVSPEEALKRLSNQNGPMRTTGLDARSLSLAAEPEGLYIFRGADGSFIVAPADDCAPAVLGYGSDFDPDNIPPAMQDWLKGYASQIAQHTQAPQKSDNKEDSDKEDEEDHEPIDFMVTSKWNQSHPYNLLCPSDAGGRSVTGCLATAIAQIINYHKWPVIHGDGRHSYLWNGRLLAFNYGNTKFEWENMLDSYDYLATEAEKQAVATLMYACGVGVNMDYSSSASGASDIYISGFLANNMDFDPGTAYLQRDWFSTEDWDNIVYSELADGRPVLYCGQSQQGGHAFVCDGYAGKGYYHINWGWGGVSDGNFLLSALDPYNQGIGGSGNGSGFNTGQSIVVGIKPATDNTVWFLPFYCYGGLVWADEYEMFGFMNNGEMQGCFNFSGEDFTVDFAMKLDDGDGHIYYALDIEGTTTVPGADGYSIQGISGIQPVYPDDLPAGSYEASPVARQAGTDVWQECMIPYGMDRTVTVRKGVAGNFTFDGSDPDQGSSIIAIEKNAESTTVYNLQGIKVADDLHTLPAGVYIVNGKKTLIK